MGIKRRANGERGLILLVLFVFVLFPVSVVVSQERKPLSVANIEFLLKESISPKRLAELIEELGVNFKVTEEIRGRLKRAGGDNIVLQAVEKAGLEFARKKFTDERRKVEEESQKVEIEKRRVEEEKRKAEEKQRIEEAKREEERRRGVEAKRREERRRIEEAGRKKTSAEVPRNLVGKWQGVTSQRSNFVWIINEDGHYESVFRNRFGREVRRGGKMWVTPDGSIHYRDDRGQTGMFTVSREASGAQVLRGRVFGHRVTFKAKQVTREKSR